MGRPLKYTEEIINKHADGLVAFMAIPDNFWIKDYAILNKFPSEYITIWAEANEYFSQSLKKVKDIQESKLVKIGMTKGSNYVFVIFTLKNVAKWRDQEANDNGLTQDQIIKLRTIADGDFKNNI